MKVEQGQSTVQVKEASRSWAHQLVFYHCNKTLTKTNQERKELVSTYRFQSNTKGKVGQEFREGILRHELKQKPQDIAYWLLWLPMLQCPGLLAFLCNQGPSSQGWHWPWWAGPFHIYHQSRNIVSQAYVHTRVHTERGGRGEARLMETILQLSFPLPR